MPHRSRAGAGRRASFAAGGGSRPHSQSAARHASCHQGRAGRRRPADTRWQQDPRADRAEHDRRSCRDAAQSRGRRCAWQGAHHRVRLFRWSAADPQSAQCRAHAGRLQRRTGRRCCLGHGAAEPRHADRGLREPPRGLLRHRCVQAQYARLVELRARSLRAELRHDRHFRASRARCGHGGACADAALLAAARGRGALAAHHRRCRGPDYGSRKRCSRRQRAQRPARLWLRQASE